MKFCVKCGKSIEEGVMCPECKGTKVDVKPLKLSFCSCNRYLGPKGWREYTSLSDVVKHALQPAPEQILSKPDLNFDHKEKKFSVKCLYGSKEVIVPVTLRKRTCDKCEKKSSEYFEGILQIRYEQDQDGQIYEDVKEVMDMALKKRVFVTKVVEQKKGVDLYVTSQRYLQVLAKKLQRRWGAKLKMTSTLHTRNKQTSKNLYRVTALLTLYNFRKGSVVKQGGKLYKIETLGKGIKAIDLSIHKMKTFNLDDYEVLEQYKTRVVKVRPNIEVLDPETYESVPVKNPKHAIEGMTMNKQIKVVFHKGWWIV
ncbi:hypothetical protein JW868_04755 [Candidatus Woesearchaeota archaeon]|nr:hypothetical protein [Candidatus Woesearchaeota archaeon]